jgi:hypothetical protein
MPAVVITAAAVSPFSMAPPDMVNPLDILAANARIYSQSKARRVESDSCDALQVLFCACRYPGTGSHFRATCTMPRPPRISSGWLH